MTTACLLALIFAGAGWAAYLAGLSLITVMLEPPS